MLVMIELKYGLNIIVFKNPNKNFKDAVSNYINEFTKN